MKRKFIKRDLNNWHYYERTDEFQKGYVLRRIKGGKFQLRHNRPNLQWVNTATRFKYLFDIGELIQITEKEAKERYPNCFRSAN